MIRNTRGATRARKPAFIPRLTALEDRTLLATLVVDPAGGPGIFTTIQAAVTAANPAGGDTIQIHPATYTEQVTINKSLTMLGTGPGTIIQAPNALTPEFGQNPLVEIGGGAMVNMSDLTLEGPAPASVGNGGIVGIYVVGGATANVTETTIDNMRQNPLNGVQTGFGILIGSTSQGQVGNATITDCTITDYQKDGIVTGGNGTTVKITGTTVTGVGPTALIAQNGIQISPGTTMAEINSSTITGNQYTLANFSAAGILNYGGNTTVNFNRIVNNSVGLFNNAAAAVDAAENWWGSNTGPNTTGNDTTFGAVNTGPWLVLSLSASPTTIGPGGTSSVTASLTSDSSGATHLTAPFFPNGTPIAFSATGGTITPSSAPTQSGRASSIFTSTTSGDPSVSAKLDNQTVSVTIEVSPAVKPPVVESLQRFGVHAQPTTFVLTFSTALEPAPAEDVANYQLNPIFRHRLGRAIQIKAATYDPIADTVTLQPARRVYLFAHYRLVVNGSTPAGVAGFTGLLLDGNGNGQPGSDFVTTFGKSILTGQKFQVERAERSLLPRSRSKTEHAPRHH